jgi:pimeloyl-ACP methyl ester carboxylesterase
MARTSLWLMSILAVVLALWAGAAISAQDRYAVRVPGGESDPLLRLSQERRSHPKWQAWMGETQPRLLVIWGKHDMSFDLWEPQAYRRDVPNAEVHVLDAGHFALDTAADEIAQLVRRFME